MNTGIKTALMVIGLIVLVLVFGYLIGHYVTPLANAQGSTQAVLLSNVDGVQVYLVDYHGQRVYYAVCLSSTKYVSICTP
jgi:hypothetical protein